MQGVRKTGEGEQGNPGEPHFSNLFPICHLRRGKWIEKNKNKTVRHERTTFPFFKILTKKRGTLTKFVDVILVKTIFKLDNCKIFSKMISDI
jgi:hypothetical protein